MRRDKATAGTTSATTHLQNTRILHVTHAHNTNSTPYMATYTWELRHSRGNRGGRRSSEPQKKDIPQEVELHANTPAQMPQPTQPATKQKNRAA